MLGVMLLEDHERPKDCIEQIVKLCGADDFFVLRNRRIAEVAVRLHMDGYPLNIASVLDTLSQRGMLEEVGGYQYVSELLVGTPTAANIGYYARQVAEASFKRKMACLTEELHASALNGIDARTLLSQARLRLSDLEADVPTTDENANQEWPTLAELKERPDLLQAPEERLPRLAWRGRATLLAGPDKSGKSTLLAHGVSVLSRGGWFLGAKVSQGRAVVCAPDEAVGDTVRRLVELRADHARVRVLCSRPPDLLASLQRLLLEWPAKLVVVDSLAEWARLTLGHAPEDGDAAGWGTVVRPLVSLAHEQDVSLVLLHHPRRSDGQYRGSGEIAAAVDALIEMRPPEKGEDSTVRHFSGRARWPLESWSVRMDGGRYDVMGGAVSLDARVLAFVERDPGCSRKAIRTGLGVGHDRLKRTLAALFSRALVVEREGGIWPPSAELIP